MKARKIFYNTLAQSLGKIIALALGLFTISLLTRHLGESGFGQYSTVLAFMGLVVVFADLGLYLIVVREISKSKNNKGLLSNALGLRLTSAVAALLVGAGIVWLLPYALIVKQTMLVAILAFLFVSLNQVLIGVFQKHLVQYLTVVSEVIGRAVNLGLVWLFIQNSLSLPFFLLALVFANGLQFTLTLVFAKRYEKFSITFDFIVWKKILKTSWPLAFAVVLNLIYFKTDTVFLSIFQPQEAVGVYSLSYKILEVLLAFPAMFVGLIMPLLSRYAFKNWEKFNKVLQHSFDALAVVVTPMIISVWFFSEEIINVIKGPGTSYADSPLLLNLLIVAAGFIFFGTLYGYAVVAVDKQKAMIKGYLSAAIVGLTAYFILIPMFSYWGAATGTILTELIVFLYAFYLVHKRVPKTLNLSILAKLFSPALFLAVSFYILDLNWIIEVVIGLTLFGSTAIAFKAVPIEFIKQMVFLRKSN